MKNKILGWAFAVVGASAYGLAVYSKHDGFPETVAQTPDTTIFGHLSAFYFSRSTLNAQELIKAEAAEGCLDNYEQMSDQTPKTCAYVFNTFSAANSGVSTIPELSGTAHVSCATAQLSKIKTCKTIQLALKN